MLPIKGVISGVVLEVNAKDISEELDQVVRTERLNRMVDILFFDEWSLPSQVYFG
jgi:hypothetical protein